MSPEALAELQQYSFPGNVRELKNIMERALIKSGSGVILPGHLHLLDDIVASVEGAGPAMSRTQTMAESDFERRKQLVVKRAQKLSSPDDAPSPPASAPTEEEQILAHVERHGSINNAECRELLSVDYDHASYLLKKLNDYGLLAREGDRRCARHYLPLPSSEARDNRR